MSLLLLGAGSSGAGDSTAPTIQSATIGSDGETLTIVLSEAVNGHAGFTLDPSGGAAGLTYSNGDGTDTLVFAIDRVIYDTETATGDYAMGDVEDLSGNALEAVTDFAVTNNSEQVPASEGPNNPGTAAQDSSNGSALSWATLDNIRVADSNAATVSVTAGNYTPYIIASNFFFSFLSGTTIVGIKVEVSKWSGANRIVDRDIRIVKGGVIGAVNKASGAFWPTSDSYSQYGGATDLWGETWTRDDINDPNFGVAIAAQCPTTSGIARVQHVRITVYYTM